MRRLAELHVHLEGTIRPETLAALCARNGLPKPPPNQYSDLAGFLDVYAQVARGLVTSRDFERVISEHGEAMSRQGIVYAEISVNPNLHSGDDWTDGLVRGRRALAKIGMEIAWLVEMVRGAPPGANERALDLALSTEGVVGLGLVGDESISAAPLVALVDQARGAGLGFMPHAGQVGGPEVVREAVEMLGATRLAHGVGAERDDDVLQVLADRGVCLCVCPSSNRRIGLNPDFRKFADLGIPLTVNTDDPAMVPTTLENELSLAESAYGLNGDVLLAAAWDHRFIRNR